MISHTHNELCYFPDGSLRCTIPEHEHALACVEVRRVSAAPFAAQFVGATLGASPSGMTGTSTYYNSTNGIDVGSTYFSDPTTWSIEDIMNAGTLDDNGKIMTDKSVVYGKDSLGAFASCDENVFTVALSAMGQGYDLTATYKVRAPMDVVYVLDVSASMLNNDLNDNSVTPNSDANGQKTRAYAMIAALNDAIQAVYEDNELNRVGVVLFSSSSTEFLPLGRYRTTSTDENDQFPYVKISDFSSNNGVRASLNSSSTLQKFNEATGRYEDYQATEFRGDHNGQARWGGTYTQRGISHGAELLIEQGSDSKEIDITIPVKIADDAYQDITKTVARKPVLVLLTDGLPTYYSTNISNPTASNRTGSGNESTSNCGPCGYRTIQSGLYFKQQITEAYSVDGGSNNAIFYTIGMGNFGTNDQSNFAKMVLDPNETHYNNLSTSNYGGAFRNQLSNDTNFTANHDYYDYADGSQVQQFKVNELANALSDFITSDATTHLYGIILTTKTRVEITDTIGEGMMLVSDPVLMIGETAYTHTSTETVNGNTVRYLYENEDIMVNEDYIYADVTTDPVTGEQKVELTIPESLVPLRMPILSTIDNVHKTAEFTNTEPARLVYQVGLTEEAQAQVEALFGTGNDAITFYTNKWDSDGNAFSEYWPLTSNPYYAKNYDKSTTNKSGSVTDTKTYVRKFDNASTATHVQIYLGNNGKIEFYSPYMPVVPSAKIIKIDADGNKITNDTATFAVYSDAACTRLVGSYTTSRGEITLTDELRANKDYYIKETDAPNMYQRIDSATHVTLTEDGEFVLVGTNDSHYSVNNEGVLVVRNDVITTTVTANKVWSPSSGTHPAVKFRLLADGAAYGDDIILSGSNRTATWDNLPRYDRGDGHEIYYSVVEVAVPEGYYSSNVRNRDGSYTITNTKIGETSISVYKKWKDGMRSSVTVELYRNDVATGETVVLNAENEWFYKWENLPDHDSEGNAITYAVHEYDVSGFTKDEHKWNGRNDDEYISTTVIPDVPDTPAIPKGKWTQQSSFTRNQQYVIVYKYNGQFYALNAASNSTLSAEPLGITDIGDINDTDFTPSGSALWTAGSTSGTATLKNGQYTSYYLNRDNNAMRIYGTSSNFGYDNTNHRFYHDNDYGSNYDRYFTGAINASGQGTLNSSTGNATEVYLYTYEPPTVWTQTTTLTDGEEYLIVYKPVGSSDYYLMSANGDTNIQGTTIDINNIAYYDAQNTELWKSGSSGTTWQNVSTSYYLRRNSSNIIYQNSNSRTLTYNTTNKTWSFDNSGIRYFTGISDGGGTTSSRANQAAEVLFFEKKLIPNWEEQTSFQKDGEYMLVYKDGSTFYALNARTDSALYRIELTGVTDWDQVPYYTSEVADTLIWKANANGNTAKLTNTGYTGTRYLRRNNIGSGSNSNRRWTVGTDNSNNTVVYDSTDHTLTVGERYFTGGFSDNNSTGNVTQTVGDSVEIRIFSKNEMSSAPPAPQPVTTYDHPISDFGATHYVIVNKKVQNSLPVSKLWGENVPTSRISPVTVRLFTKSGNNAYNYFGDPITLSAETDWAGYFTGLDPTVTYYIAEDTNSVKLEASYRDSTSESTDTIDTIQITVGTGENAAYYNGIPVSIAPDSEYFINEVEITNVIPESGIPVHTKTIDKLSDLQDNPDTDLDDGKTAAELKDLYRLYLNVGPENVYNALDVIFIIDRSTSMSAIYSGEGKDAIDILGNEDVWRRQALNSLLNGLDSTDDYVKRGDSNDDPYEWSSSYPDAGNITSVHSNGLISNIFELNPQNKVAVGWFAEDAGSVYGNTALYGSGASDWTTEATPVLDNQSISGTNYVEGLIQAQKFLNDESIKSDGNEKLLIFISDGNPTSYTTALSGGTHYYHDNNKSPRAKNADIDPITSNVINEFLTYCDQYRTETNSELKIVTVGVGDFDLQHLAHLSTSGDVVGSINNSGSLDFQYILRLLDHEINGGTGRYTALNVTDALSDYVDFYTEDLDMIIKKTDSDGQNPVILYENGELKEYGEIYLDEVNVDFENKTVEMTFDPEYEEEGYCIFSLSFNVKATDAAYQQYADNVAQYGKSGQYADELDPFGGYAGVKGDGVEITVGDNTYIDPLTDTDFRSLVSDREYQNETSTLKPGLPSNAEAIFEYKIKRYDGTFEESSPFYEPVIQVDTTTVAVRKEWTDGNEKHNGEKITANLIMIDGNGTETVIKTFDLDETCGWRKEFTNLPNNRSYRVVETSVPTGYIVKYSTDPVNGDLIITNAKRVSIDVSKVWFGTPDLSATFLLYAGRNKIAAPLLNDAGKQYTLTANAGNGWNASLMNLPAPAEGETYYIVEKTIKGYVTLYENSETIQIGSDFVPAAKLVFDTNAYASATVTNMMGNPLPSTGGITKTERSAPLSLGCLALAAVGCCFVPTGKSGKKRRSRASSGK